MYVSVYTCASLRQPQPCPMYIVSAPAGAHPEDAGPHLYSPPPSMGNECMGVSQRAHCVVQSSHSDILLWGPFSVDPALLSGPPHQVPQPLFTLACPCCSSVQTDLQLKISISAYSPCRGLPHCQPGCSEPTPKPHMPTLHFPAGSGPRQLTPKPGK